MKKNNVYVCVITHDRPDFLESRTFPSIKNQIYSISGFLLVDDSEEPKNRIKNQDILKNQNFINAIYMKNKRTPGAAGAWNTGIDWVFSHDQNAFIAFLDDDDEWTPEHISTCIQHVEGVHAVVSGMRILKNGELIAENCPQHLSQAKFLEGNPGWQGSNTFISVAFIKKIGGFDEDLLCTHDRNLAIKCFEEKEFRYSTTGICTVIYHLEFNRTSLTIPKGYGKKTGLLQFFKKHHEKMTEENKKQFRKRAEELFGVNPAYFDLIENKDEYKSNWKSPKALNNGEKLFFTKFKVKIRQKWAIFRMKKWVSKVLGLHFHPSTNQIEIDLTYECNLYCKNCNRSCRQAPEKLELKLEKIQKFITDSIQQGRKWNRIRILGGEPTLHSQFEEILYTLMDYKLISPYTRLELVSNGFGENVKRKLLKVPPLFYIENSEKQSIDQESFYPFNLAPCDDPYYKNVDYRNGCSNLTECGMGLTPLGYYPCTLAGGIDRILKKELGFSRLPEKDADLTKSLEIFCALCGRFKPRIFIPSDIRPNLDEELISESWVHLYQSWRDKQNSRV